MLEFDGPVGHHTVYVTGRSIEELEVQLRLRIVVVVDIEVCQSVVCAAVVIGCKMGHAQQAVLFIEYRQHVVGIVCHFSSDGHLSYEVHRDVGMQQVFIHGPFGSGASNLQGDGQRLSHVVLAYQPDDFLKIANVRIR